MEAEATILHVDADAFFASVEQLLEPRYRGKPVVVGGDHRGVVASASYEARRYGIHSAMPIYQARQLCPRAIFVKGQHALYAHFSREMFKIFKEYTPTVEITSVDEGYLDLSGTRRLHKADYPEIAFRILTHVHQKLGFSISGALSTNKLVSKVSASLYKPRRLSWILPGHEKKFLEPLPLRVIPGVGPKSLPKFELLGLHTVGDLAAMPLDTVWDLWGGYGLVLWEHAQGIDRSPVSPEGYRRKSISEEKTFPLDIESQDLLYSESKKMLKNLCFELRRQALYAKTLTLKIRYKDFQTFTHQKTLDTVSHAETDFTPTLKELLKNRDPQRYVRLIGVTLSHLQNEVQLNLFEDGKLLGPGVRGRHKKELESALDRLRMKYGINVI